MDRFDLEESIMSCWSTKEDIELICSTLTGGDCDIGKIANALTGLAELHEMRCKKTFEIFEKVLLPEAEQAPKVLTPEVEQAPPISEFSDWLDGQIEDNTERELDDGSAQAMRTRREFPAHGSSFWPGKTFWPEPAQDRPVKKKKKKKPATKR